MTFGASKQRMLTHRILADFDSDLSLNLANCQSTCELESIRGTSSDELRQVYVHTQCEDRTNRDIIANTEWISPQPLHSSFDLDRRPGDTQVCMEGKRRVRLWDRDQQTSRDLQLNFRFGLELESNGFSGDTSSQADSGRRDDNIQQEAGTTRPTRAENQLWRSPSQKLFEWVNFPENGTDLDT